jgi:SAM-dependent methyltransferase
MVNSGQAEAWNGYEGRHWAEHQDRYDAVNDGANTPLLDASGVRDGQRLLDIGCGNGRITRLAARRGAHALGLDLSAPMLARAAGSARAEGLDQVTLVQGDAQVHPFAEASFDVAVSRLGVMFFADPVAAFGNIGRALRPGGRLAFICPREFGRTEASVIFDAIGEQVALPDLSGNDGPASFADPGRVEQVLTGAGFARVVPQQLAVSQHWGTDAGDAADFLIGWGPVRHWLYAADADEKARLRARDAAAEAFRAFETDKGVILAAQLWLVTADRP